VLQAVLLVILIFVCIALVGVILMQQSEGGALGMGGGPSGFMSTRGVGDLLSRTTGVLAGAFFVLCLALTLIIGRAHKGDAVVDRLKIPGLDPASLARQPAAPAATGGNTTAPAANPNAPLLEAPKPEVHTAPSAPPLLAPAPATTSPSKP
jgi:preprotein translocase subunit SecG